jgi:hypothetical protein
LPAPLLNHLAVWARAHPRADGFAGGASLWLESSKSTGGQRLPQSGQKSTQLIRLSRRPRCGLMRLSKREESGAEEAARVWRDGKAAEVRRVVAAADGGLAPAEEEDSEQETGGRPRAVLTARQQRTAGDARVPSLHEAEGTCRGDLAALTSSRFSLRHSLLHRRLPASCVNAPAAGSFNSEVFTRSFCRFSFPSLGPQPRPTPTKALPRIAATKGAAISGLVTDTDPDSGHSSPSRSAVAPPV